MAGKTHAVNNLTTRYYYNNNWQVLAETDYDSTGPTETQLRDYIYGNYIDEVLIMTDDSNAEHYYAHDHIFSVVALIEDDGDELSWGWWPYLHYPIISITKDNSKLSHA